VSRYSHRVIDHAKLENLGDVCACSWDRLELNHTVVLNEGAPDWGAGPEMMFAATVDFPPPPTPPKKRIEASPSTQCGSVLSAEINLRW